jgi:hypothetical protein
MGHSAGRTEDEKLKNGWHRAWGKAHSELIEDEKVKHFDCGFWIANCGLKG